MIVLISSGQPSLNPRLVKEADALTEAGYEVTVIYQYWNQWGTAYDPALLSQKKWKSIRVGGTPNEEKVTFWKTRLINKIAVFFAKNFGFDNGIAEMAIGRCMQLLIKKAESIPAQFYIAHNLAAIPAAYRASIKNKGKYGFDAEDFHRNEESNDPDSFEVRLKTYLEDKYFPKLNHFTTASPLISWAYQEIYEQLTPTTLLNVFPAQRVAKSSIQSDKLKLFWFSQTIGLNRGLEIVIAAMGLLKDLSIELHLLGAHDENTIQTFTEIAAKENINSYQIQFYQPIAPNDIFAFAAQFDIGLATETSIPKNRDICLTNKIFTYIQSQLAIVASATSAQQDLLKSYPKMGKLFSNNDPRSLADVLTNYAKDRQLLLAHQLQALHYAQKELNWEKESLKLINQVRQVIA